MVRRMIYKKFFCSQCIATMSNVLFVKFGDNFLSKALLIVVELLSLCSVHGRAGLEPNTGPCRASNAHPISRLQRRDAATANVRIVNAAAVSERARRCGSPATGPLSVSTTLFLCSYLRASPTFWASLVKNWWKRRRFPPARRTEGFSKFQ